MLVLNNPIIFGAAKIRIAKRCYIPHGTCAYYEKLLQNLNILLMNLLLHPKLVMLTVVLCCGVSAYADEAAQPPASSTSPSLVEKVEKPIERGAKAAARGIKKGVTAGAHGVERGAKAAARGIEHGAAATTHAVKSVAHKVAGTTASAPAPAASH